MRNLGSTIRRLRTLALLGASSLLLVACVTPGMQGAYPGGYGQTGQGQYGQQPYGQPIVGTVRSVDRGYGRILLTVEDGGGYGGQQVAVRYDERTRLVYQGQAYPVEGLEPGDVIRIDATQSGREWWARSVEVVRNVREGGGYGGSPGGAYDDLRGTVGLVDTRYRTIRLDGAGYGGVTQVGYDNRTVVEYQGRSYRPENLQRGDLVRIQARRGNDGRWFAERILVERSVGRY